MNQGERCGVWGRAVQKNGGSSFKSKEEGRGAQGWECTLRVERRGRATKKGYTTLKRNTRSQNLGLILEHRSALERRGKKKKKKPKANRTL